jgi:hypothetical protein
MTRLLIQYIDENPFGDSLHEFGTYESFNEAVETAIILMNDDTISTILANDGSRWVRLK